MPQALIEQIDVIAALGQVRDEPSPNVMQDEALGLGGLAYADPRPNPFEKIVKSVE
jgi:hypothetical protein